MLADQTPFFVNWYDANGREFPWRQGNVTPFQFLVTEMLLRQTRAEQVARVWKHVTGKYETPEMLVKAAPSEVFEDVKDLGFGNQRVEALKQAAKWLVEHCNSRVPEDKEALLRMPHVGLYVSHAVLCFAFGHAVPVVDVNILRLLGRISDIQIRQMDIRRNPWAWEEAGRVLPGKPVLAVLHNYGMLDFTAQVCKPRKPLCKACPLLPVCEYGQATMKA